MNKVAVPEGAAGSPPFREWPDAPESDALHGAPAGRGPVNSGRAATRHEEPRRVVRNREEYRDAAWRDLSRAQRFASECAEEGRPAGSGNLLKDAGSSMPPATEASRRLLRLVAPRFSGQGPAAPAVLGQGANPGL